MSRPGVDPARRAFLRGAPLTEEGRRDFRRSQSPLGPRPPWLPAGVGPEICAGCEAPCIQACPPGIMRRYGPAHRLAGAIHLWFGEAGCTLCGDCAEVCPHTPAADGRPRLGTARLERERCLAWNGVVCMSCITRCEARALHRDARGRVDLVAGRCTGCGRCVSACPADAVAVRPL